MCQREYKNSKFERQKIRTGVLVTYQVQRCDKLKRKAKVLIRIEHNLLYCFRRNSATYSIVRDL